MDDFLDLLTYTCPYTGKRRCAVQAGLATDDAISPHETLSCIYSVFFSLMRMVGLLFCPICVYIYIYEFFNSAVYILKKQIFFLKLYYTKKVPGQSVTGLRRTRVPSNQLLPPVKPTVPNTPMKRICKWHFFGGVVPRAWSLTTLTSWFFSLNHLRIKSSKKFKPF